MKCLESFLFCVALIGTLIITCFWRPEVGLAEENKPPLVSGKITTSSPITGQFDYLSNLRGEFTADDRPIELEYHLWTLVGEPLWGFRAKTAPFTHLSFHTQAGTSPLLDIIVQDIIPAGTVRWNGAFVEVSRDIMDLASIYDFAFHARLAAPSISGISDEGYPIDTAAIYRQHQGIAGDPGDWGWTVPGSPNWASMLTHRPGMPYPVTRESFDDRPIGADASKQIMKNVLEEFADRDDVAISRLETGDYQVRVGDLLHEIWKQEPDALSALMGVSSDYHRELADIMMGVAADLRRTGGTGDPAREAERIDEILATHSEKFPNQLRQRWMDMKAEALEVAADRQLAEVMRKAGPLMTTRLGAGDVEASNEVTRYLELGRDRMQASDHVSETMKRRWRALESAVVSPTEASAMRGINPAMEKFAPEDLDPGAKFGRFATIGNNAIVVSARENFKLWDGRGEAVIHVFDHTQEGFNHAASFTKDDVDNYIYSPPYVQGMVMHENKAIIRLNEELVPLRRTVSGWVRDEYWHGVSDTFSTRSSIGLHGDTMIIGSRLANRDPVLNVYKLNGSEWEFVERFEPRPEPNVDYAFFGSVIDFDGDFILATGEQYGEGNPSIPVSFISANESGFSEISRFIPEPANEPAKFDRGLSFNDNTAAIQSFKIDEQGNAISTLRIFERNGDTWHPKQTLLGRGEGTWFGSQIIVEGKFVLASSMDSDGRYAIDIFREIGDDWQRMHTLVPKNGHPNDWFGASISSNGSEIIIGAPWDNTVGERAGAVYLLSLDALEGLGQ